jgi:TonB family protein
MNSFIAVTSMIAWLLFSNNQPQNPYVEKQLLFEKRAIADTQMVLASDLDAELPRLSFAAWFEGVVGPGAGVIWQLSECGDSTEAALDATDDMRACVEANTILADGRGVIIRITVGTFKKGITGAPAFYFGVIEQEGNLFLVRRLRDLQKQLSAPGSLANRHVVELPESHMPTVRLAANKDYGPMTPAWSLPAWIFEDFSQLIPIEEPAPAEPPPRTEPAPSNRASNTEKQNLSETVLQGAAVFKPQPAYPRNAKRFNASGPVEVRVTISATGRVTGAKAISGHPMLREVAVEAALKWIFNPTTVNGVPVETQLSLTFVFPVPQ